MGLFLRWSRCLEDKIIYLFGLYPLKSRIRETKNLSTDADSRTVTVLETTGFATHVFYQEIAADGRALREG